LVGQEKPIEIWILREYARERGWNGSEKMFNEIAGKRFVASADFGQTNTNESAGNSQTRRV